jgi:Trypsin-like peptidase domain
MKHHVPRFLTASLVLVFLVRPIRAGPEDAVVRLPSHGASATVIYTSTGRTLLLGCAHAFEGKDRFRPITVDVPTSTPTGVPRRPGVRLLAVDEQRDLSLIEIADGPLPFVCPVAPAVGAASRAAPIECVSVGFDGMRWPVTVRTATLLGSRAERSFTRERPGHGRSGGALIEKTSGMLIGVVHRAMR